MHTGRGELVEGFGLEFSSKTLLFSNAATVSSYRRFPWTIWKSDFFQRLHAWLYYRTAGILSLSIYKITETPRPPIYMI
jgi:hypothetical protein